MADHDWHEVAARTWDVLTEHALQKHQLYYSELADRLDIHHRLVRIPLDLLQDYCLEQGLPPLTILVISRSSDLPGSGFIAAPAEALAEKLRDVLEWPWHEEPNPYGFARDGTTMRELVDRVLSGPEEAREVLEQVPGRGPQQGLFRRALLDAYRGRCAFSGSTLEATLEASHIVPWAEATQEERIDVQNGLLLNAYFHRLFDQHVLRVDEHYKLSLTAGFELEQLSDFDQRAIEPILGETLRFPRHKQFFPRRDYLLRRYANEEM